MPLKNAKRVRAGRGAPRVDAKAQAKLDAKASPRAAAGKDRQAAVDAAAAKKGAPAVAGGVETPAKGPAAPGDAAAAPMDAKAQDAKFLQSRLTQLGYKTKEDGVKGPKTDRAVKAFQRENGLKTDGVVGPQTTAGLRRAQPREGGVSDHTGTDPDWASTDFDSSDEDDVATAVKGGGDQGGDAAASGPRIEVHSKSGHKIVIHEAESAADMPQTCSGHTALARKGMKACPKCKASLLPLYEAQVLLDRLSDGQLDEAVDETVIAFDEWGDALLEASDKGAEPFSTSKTSNWVARAGGLPHYIQHIAHDLVEKRGMDESRAISMAIGIVKRWARGGGGVKPDTRAAAAKAVAEWEKLKAKNAAKKISESVYVESKHKRSHGRFASKPGTLMGRNGASMNVEPRHLKPGAPQSTRSGAHAAVQELIDATQHHDALDYAKRGFKARLDAKSKDQQAAVQKQSIARLERELQSGRMRNYGGRYNGGGLTKAMEDADRASHAKLIADTNARIDKLNAEGEFLRRAADNQIAAVGGGEQREIADRLKAAKERVKAAKAAVKTHGSVSQMRMALAEALASLSESDRALVESVFVELEEAEVFVERLHPRNRTGKFAAAHASASRMFAAGRNESQVYATLRDEHGLAAPDAAKMTRDVRNMPPATLPVSAPDGMASPGQAPQGTPAKKPYGGMGPFVVLQHNGGGMWSPVQGAKTMDTAKRHARQYPGQTRVVDNSPGAAPHPGTYYGSRGFLAPPLPVDQFGRAQSPPSALNSVSTLRPSGEPGKEMRDRVRASLASGSRIPATNTKDRMAAPQVAGEAPMSARHPGFGDPSGHLFGRFTPGGKPKTYVLNLDLPSGSYSARDYPAMAKRQAAAFARSHPGHPIEVVLPGGALVHRHEPSSRGMAHPGTDALEHHRGEEARLTSEIAAMLAGKSKAEANRVRRSPEHARKVRALLAAQNAIEAHKGASGGGAAHPGFGGEPAAPRTEVDALHAAIERLHGSHEYPIIGEGIRNIGGVKKTDEGFEVTVRGKVTKHATARGAALTAHKVQRQEVANHNARQTERGIAAGHQTPAPVTPMRLQAALRGVHVPKTLNRHASATAAAIAAVAYENEGKNAEAEAQHRLVKIHGRGKGGELKRYIEALRLAAHRA